MQTPSNIKSKYALKDSSKGHKIVAALYLVTGHLSDTDPLKAKIRTHALVLIEPHALAIHEAVTLIQSLLAVSVLSGVMSEKNAAILHSELAAFLAESKAYTHIGALFEQPVEKPVMDKVFVKDNMSFSSVLSDTKKDHRLSFENKNKRQDEILHFINERKSAGIKDIAALFSDISEKTIQRELTSLVEHGKITKRGSKRWSIYMAVSA